MHFVFWAQHLVHRLNVILAHVFRRPEAMRLKYRRELATSTFGGFHGGENLRRIVGIVVDYFSSADFANDLKPS